MVNSSYASRFELPLLFLIQSQNTQMVPGGLWDKALNMFVWFSSRGEGAPGVVLSFKPFSLVRVGADVIF